MVGLTVHGSGELSALSAPPNNAFKPKPLRGLA
jgi:hypothetical protein